ncbi:MAG TPA: peptidylprolyl isomerase [Polyangia bacterium]|nr:peptidylprolyl isomerase [Polyangia bacterium]
MQIGNQKVVTIDYTLTDEQGEVLDTSQGQEPLVYIQGSGTIIPGLEEALEGKQVGDALSVKIDPSRGYGERDEELVQEVPRERFPAGGEITVGMRFHAQGTGGSHVVTVVAVDDKKVTVDANHPLAGVTLSFDVKVLEIREATADELKHGHVHGKGGHQH